MNDGREAATKAEIKKKRKKRRSERKNGQWKKRRYEGMVEERKRK